MWHLRRCTNFALLSLHSSPEYDKYPRRKQTSWLRLINWHTNGASSYLFAMQVAGLLQYAAEKYHNLYPNYWITTYRYSSTITKFGVYLPSGLGDSCSFLNAGKGCSIFPSSLSLSLIKLCIAPFARPVLFIVCFGGSLRNMTTKKGNVSLELMEVAIFTMLSPYSNYRSNSNTALGLLKILRTVKGAFIGEIRKGLSSGILPEAYGYHGASPWRTRRPGNRWNTAILATNRQKDHYMPRIQD